MFRKIEEKQKIGVGTIVDIEGDQQIMLVQAQAYHVLVLQLWDNTLQIGTTMRVGDPYDLTQEEFKDLLRYYKVVCVNENKGVVTKVIDKPFESDPEPKDKFGRGSVATFQNKAYLIIGSLEHHLFLVDTDTMSIISRVDVVDNSWISKDEFLELVGILSWNMEEFKVFNQKIV